VIVRPSAAGYSYSSGFVSGCLRIHLFLYKSGTGRPRRPAALSAESSRCSPDLSVGGGACPQEPFQANGVIQVASQRCAKSSHEDVCREAR
jgi:hypothetical protein